VPAGRARWRPWAPGGGAGGGAATLLRRPGAPRAALRAVLLRHDRQLAGSRALQRPGSPWMVCRLQEARINARASPPARLGHPQRRWPGCRLPTSLAQPAPSRRVGPPTGARPAPGRCRACGSGPLQQRRTRSEGGCASRRRVSWLCKGPAKAGKAACTALCGWLAGNAPRWLQGSRAGCAPA
jgi:hypothetical protein